MKDSTVEEPEPELLKHRVNLARLEKVGERKPSTKDKSDRATSEQVLDPRTRMILFKLLNNNVLTSIDGCISTGKEANVYYACSNNGAVAVKIYKTSILVFKDRDRYVTGEFRFRNGYCRKNPRKMVKMWAEKEFRNLLRIKQAGIPCPIPILVRGHVLLMQFFGSNGWPAPKLKDVTLSQKRWCRIYYNCCTYMRTLYHSARLVHADLSEYNMLYYRGDCVFIDVSQSVEHDHPEALNFLRKDCANVTSFFQKKDVLTMTARELFNFITDITITSDNIDACMERIKEIVAQRGNTQSNKELVDDAVFQKAFIPRTLDQVIDFERDRDEVLAGEADTDNLYYQTVIGLKPDLSGAQQMPLLLEDMQEEQNEQDLQELNKDFNEEDSAETTATSRNMISSSIDNHQDVNSKIPSPDICATHSTEAEDICHGLCEDAKEKQHSTENTQEKLSSVVTSMDAGERRPENANAHLSADLSDEEGSQSNEYATENTELPGVMSRKEHKKLVKQQKREKRKNKIPKHVKKRKKKLAFKNKGNRR